MTETTDNLVTPANDGFDRHFTEKMWSLVPEVHRHEDGIAREPGKLRALIEVIAEQASIARRSVDRLWADTRADEADSWAIPYIAALLAARPVNSLDRAAQRANIARTIFYRRRNGTVRLMETLADDIADWDAVASEAFKRLFRHWHSLDNGPIRGPITHSPQWGYPDLRSVRITDVLDRAHDDLAHYADVRRHRGKLGRYNIPKVNLHLFRQYAFPLTRITPFQIADEHYTLDPSGRDRPLFQVGGRIVEDCIEAREWEMRAPIPCRRLNHSGFAPQQSHAPIGLETELTPIYGRLFSTEAAMLEAANAALASDPVPPNQLSAAQAAHLIASSMERESPRANLFPGGANSALSISIAIADDFDDPPLGPQHLYAANLEEWAADHAVANWIEALVDPELGRLRLINPLPADRDVHVQRIFYGIFGPIGAGTHDRTSRLASAGFTSIANLTPDFTVPLSGELRFMDSQTYVPQVPADGIIDVADDLTLSAAHQERPYVMLSPGAGDAITIQSSNPEAELVIDGLWIGIFGETTNAELRIDGTWRRITIRNTSLDPGGERAAAPGQPAEPIPAVRLVFQGAVGDIVISKSMIGVIEERITELDPCSTDTVNICDTIIDSGSSEQAVHLRNASLCLNNCTILGDLLSGKLDASQTLVDGQVSAEDQQSGCFRFGAAATGGRVPRPYESHFFEGGLPAGTFVSRRFADPGYVQLSEIAPVDIREGGEDGTEIGAFDSMLDPIKRTNLRTKLEEFTPINAIAQLVFET